MAAQRLELVTTLKEKSMFGKKYLNGICTSHWVYCNKYKDWIKPENCKIIDLGEMKNLVEKKIDYYTVTLPIEHVYESWCQTLGRDPLLFPEPLNYRMAKIALQMSKEWKEKIVQHDRAIADIIRENKTKDRLRNKWVRLWPNKNPQVNINIDKSALQEQFNFSRHSSEYERSVKSEPKETHLAHSHKPCPQQPPIHEFKDSSGIIQIMREVSPEKEMSKVQDPEKTSLNFIRRSPQSVSNKKTKDKISGKMSVKAVSTQPQEFKVPEVNSAGDKLEGNTNTDSFSFWPRSLSKNGPAICQANGEILNPEEQLGAKRSVHQVRHKPKKSKKEERKQIEDKGKHSYKSKSRKEKSQDDPKERKKQGSKHRKRVRSRSKPKHKKRDSKKSRKYNETSTPADTSHIGSYISTDK